MQLSIAGISTSAVRVLVLAGWQSPQSQARWAWWSNRARGGEPEQILPKPPGQFGVAVAQGRPHVLRLPVRGRHGRERAGRLPQGGGWQRAGDAHGKRVALLAVLLEGDRFHVAARIVRL